MRGYEKPPTHGEGGGFEATAKIQGCANGVGQDVRTRNDTNRSLETLQKRFSTLKHETEKKLFAQFSEECTQKLDGRRVVWNVRKALADLRTSQRRLQNHITRISK